MQAPASLGRSLVVTQDSIVPEPWSRAPSFVIDDPLLANPPKLEALVQELHELWMSRTPFVIQLFCDPEGLRSAQSTKLAPWELGGGFTFLVERLQFLIWRNSYDGRGESLIWWWGKKAESLGAPPSTDADVLIDNNPVWVDGGPRGSSAIVATIHADSIELAELTMEPTPSAEDAGGLDPGQSAAVLSPTSSARIVAPAGSGKTRTMVARVQHLIEDRSVQRRLITVLAYNKKAQQELEERLGALSQGINVRTFHSLAFAIVKGASQSSLSVLNESDVRGLLSRIARVTPRPNIDPIAPFIEALTEVRLGLTAPVEVELSRDDVPDFRNVFDQYRERMASSRSIDFEEMIYRAIETLLREPDHRLHWQQACRHMLVDEFQDLTPAFLLLLRLVASPALHVFGVGDDDQTIYGYIGADPAYLIDYQDLFPGAGLHSLEINYRCPAPVVDAAKHLLTYNSKRVPKAIRPRPDAPTQESTFAIALHSHSNIAEAAATQVHDWIQAGEPATEIAILTRVNTALLPVVAALAAHDIGAEVELPPFVGRTAVAAALSWLRLGLDPDRLDRADLMRAIRRPRIGLVREAEQRLEGHRTLSLHTLLDLGSSLTGRKAASWELFCDNIALVSRNVGGNTKRALDVILHTLGLSEAAELLDKRRTAANSAHGDDLVALERLAALHEDPVTFGEWLGDLVKTPSQAGGVRLATIHKVKGAEWDNVLLFGVDHNAMPHRLADDNEEERRILHVGITRSRKVLRIFANEQAPSRFLSELTEDAAPEALKSTSRRRSNGLELTIGDNVRMTGGYEAVVTQIDSDGVLTQLDGSAALMRLTWGQHVSLLDGRSGDLTRPSSAGSTVDAGLVERLKEWRRAIATQKGLPAYVILHDSSLNEIASTKPTTERALLEISGIGPGKIESYGEDILDLVSVTDP